LVLVLFVGYCFGEIVCIWDSYVYQKGVLCFLIHRSYVRSIKGIVLLLVLFCCFCCCCDDDDIKGASDPGM